ncbi:MAG: hypothetical protein ACOCRK_02040 [bacterium]
MSEKKKYKVSDFLNNDNEKTKKEDVVNDENKNKEEDTPKENPRQPMKERIPESEIKLIDKGMEDAIHSLKSINEVHQKAINTKLKEEDEKQEIKRQRDAEEEVDEKTTKREANEPKKSKDLFNIESKTNTRKRGKNLNKLQKLRNIKKRTRGVSFPLFESNYVIKIHGLNTFIKTRDSYNILLEKEFGFFQSLEKLKIIHEHAEFEFQDGEKIDFASFLEITSPGDLPLINMVWSLANTEDKPIDTVVQCTECGNQNNITEDLKEIFENSFTKLLEDFEYDSTLTINELQENTIMGKEKELTFVDEENEIEYNIKLSAPDLKKYMFIDDQVRMLIIDRLSDYIPPTILRTNDTDEKIKYLWNNKRQELNNIHDTYTELLLFIDLLTIKDLKDTKDNLGTIQFSILHDEIYEVQEALDSVPDDLMISISDIITDDLISGIEYRFKGEPFKCSSCGKWVKNDNKNVNDMLFFTMGSLIQRKLSDRNRN